MRFSDKNNASGRERATKLLDDRARDRFATTPRMRVQNDEARERIEARESVARRHGKPEGLIRIGTECLRQFQVPSNGMLIAINRRYLVVK